MTAKSTNTFYIYNQNDELLLDSSKENIYILNLDYSLFPSLQENTEVIPGEDGLLDLGTELQDKIINISIYIKGKNKEERLEKTKKLINVFNPKNGFVKLYLGEKMDRYYMAKAADVCPIKTEGKGDAEISLTLRCKPYAFLTENRAEFKGNSSNIDMQIKSKSDTDIPFVMEITGDTNLKPDNFWDLKNNSKNIIPNPRFQKDYSGNIPKWSVSQEYANDEEFFENEFGYSKEFPIYQDTQEEFIAKINNGTYTAQEFKIEVAYGWSGNYRQHIYNYYINNFLIYTYKDVNSGGSNNEYGAPRIMYDLRKIFNYNEIIKNNLIKSPYWTEYLVHQNLTHGTDYLTGKANADFFDNKTVVKKFNIVNNVLQVVNVMNVEKKELRIKKYISKAGAYYMVLDCFINGYLVYRVNWIIQSYVWEASNYGNVDSVTPILNHYSLLTSFNNAKFDADYLPAYGLICIPKPGGGAVYNPKMLKDCVLDAHFIINNNIVYVKNPYLTETEKIEKLIIKAENYNLNSSPYINNTSYLFTAYLKTTDGYYIGTKELRNEKKKIIQNMCTKLEYDYSGLTDDDYNVVDDGRKDDFIAKFYSLDVVDGVIQAPIDITSEITEEEINSSNDVWWDIGQKLNTVEEGSGTILTDFKAQQIMDIQHNCISVLLRPFYSLNNRYKYIYSDIISVKEAGSYVMSIYGKGTEQLKYGIVLLNDAEKFTNRLEANTQLRHAFDRFNFNMDIDMQKCVVYVKITNKIREESTEFTASVCLPQLELAPLSEFTEDGTLYSLTSAKKNLINNAGFKYSAEGLLDCWGENDTSTGRIQTEYDTDLPIDSVENKNLGYGAVVFKIAQDNTTDLYYKEKYQKIDGIKPLTTYTLSGYIKCNELGNLQPKLKIEQYNADSSLIDSKEYAAPIRSSYSRAAVTITTQAAANYIIVKLVAEKRSETTLTTEQRVKFAAAQFEENAGATKWEDDQWNAEYQIASKNLIWNPCFRDNGKDWTVGTTNINNIRNTQVSFVEDTIEGNIVNVAKFELKKESGSDDIVYVESKPFLIKQNQYYVLSFYAKGHAFYNSGEYTKALAQYVWKDDNDVIIKIEEAPEHFTGGDEFFRKKYFTTSNGGNKTAPAGATKLVLRLGVTNLNMSASYDITGTIFITMPQLEEADTVDADATAFEENYIGETTVTPPEIPSAILPIYIKNPKIYREDGTLFFGLDKTIKNTEKIIYNTEDMIAFIIKEDGTKENILDSVYKYIFNTLPSQILEEDYFYLKYTDESGLDQNTNKPVQVKIFFSWKAKTMF